MERFLVGPRLADWRRADTIGKCQLLSGLLATWRVEGLWWDLVLKVQEENDLQGPSFLRLLKKVREAPLKKNILLKNNWRCRAPRFWWREEATDHACWEEALAASIASAPPITPQ
ncbi:unnamed protein product, partial [Symbiodinium sp. CCMP2456]